MDRIGEWLLGGLIWGTCPYPVTERGQQHNQPILRSPARRRNEISQLRLQHSNEQ
jgi:hypothetical protein